MLTSNKNFFPDASRLFPIKQEAAEKAAEKEAKAKEAAAKKEEELKAKAEV
jgi:hypothetical protein